MDAAQQGNSAATRPYRLIAEVDPPKGASLDNFLQRTGQLQGRVDAVRVTDSEHAIMRMAPIAPCVTLLGRHGLAPEMVLSGRDRNRISLQADLLAAAALGIDSIVLKVGHDPAEGDQPVARSSGDLDLLTMLKCAAALNNGRDLGGEPLEGATHFTIGVALDLSDDVNINRQRADSFPLLAEHGVDSVTLGPTYDLNIIEPFLPAAEASGIRLLTSVMLLKSVTMVRYLNNLPGIPSVPQEFLRRMMAAPVKSEAGMEAAAELLRQLVPISDGVVLLAIGWKERLADFLNSIGR